jgi:hypothetical protein
LANHRINLGVFTEIRLLQIDQPINTADRKLAPHRLHVGAGADRLKKRLWPRLRFSYGQTFEDRVFEARKPLRQAKLNRVARVVVRFERATDRATLARYRVPADPFGQAFGETMLPDALQIFGLDGRIAVKCAERFTSYC